MSPHTGLARAALRNHPALLHRLPGASGTVGPAGSRSGFSRVLAAWLQRYPRAPGVAQGPARAAGSFQPLVQAAARQFGLDPALINAIIDTESGFNPQAQSPAGAKGLMQLMDATARSLGVSDAFDPVQNVMGGARLLRQLLNRYGGDLKLALAAYNAGPAAVDRYGGVPPFEETQTYMTRVLSAFEHYRQASRAGR